jgi:hypothetical protein
VLLEQQKLLLGLIAEGVNVPETTVAACRMAGLTMSGQEAAAEDGVDEDDPTRTV